MKIKTVDVIPLRVPFTDGSAGVGLMPTKWTHLDFALVRLETTDGVVGWGDAFAYSCLNATASAIGDMLAPLVKGAEIEPTPAGIAAFNDLLQRRMHLHGRYGLTIFAISAIDIALWDLAAKLAGKSVAELISGETRSTVPAYASLVRYGEPEQVATFCAKAVAEGYGHIKLHEITAPTMTIARETVGSDVKLMTDVNCNWGRADADRLCALGRDLNYTWIEEPLFPPDSEAELGDLERQWGVAIASGENACTSVEFARLAPQITYLQPSVTKVGGITEFLRVCDLAKAHGKSVMPHAPYFGPGYWATLQIMAARPECGVFERFYINPEAFLDPAIALPIGGTIEIMMRPGIGFEPDPAILSRYRVDGRT